MNLLRKLKQNLKENIAEYYMLIVLVAIIPLIVAWMVNIQWGVLLSFLVQATIGILYIMRGSK